VAFIVIVTGLGGGEFYLDKSSVEVSQKERARRFRSDRAAMDAAAEHLQMFAPVVQRAMAYRVESL
jgi:hypothetical protein